MVNNRVLSFLFLVLFIPSAANIMQAQDLRRYRFSEKKMGTRFQITFYAVDDSIANTAAQEAFERVDTLNNILSDYKRDSNLNKLTERSGDGHFIRVSPSLFRVISKAQQVSRETDGAFDITVGSYTKLWRNISKSPSPELPSSQTLDALSKKVSYKYINIDSSRSAIALDREGMQLDLGGIAKGYTADRMLCALEKYGINSALINAGGDITAGDAPPGKEGWTVVLPVHNESGEKKSLRLMVANRAIATSGSLFQHVIIDGKRYSHIVDPHTGLGLTNQRRVTVIALNGISADSYASAVSVLGPQKGASLIADKPGAALRMETRGKDKITVISTPSFVDYMSDQ